MPATTADFTVQKSTQTTSAIDLQTWNPYDGCLQASAFSNFRPMIYAEIIEGIIALADVYSQLQSGSGGDVSQTLQAIQNALVEVKYKLEQINNNLVILQQLLLALPQEIRDIVSASQFSLTMGGALALCGQVKDYSADADVDAHQGELTTALNNLDFALGQISGVKGVVGQYLSLPMVSIWLAGSVALERSKQRTSGGTYKPLTPWKRNLMIRSSDALATLFSESLALLDSLQNQELPDFPRHGWALRMVNGVGGVLHFENVSSLGIGGLVFPGAYQISCPKAGVTESLLIFSSVPPPGQWYKVTAASDVDVLNRTLARRNEILQFKDFYPQLVNIQAQMIQTFSEPADMWKM